MTDLQDRAAPAAPTVTEFVCNGSTVRVGDHPHLLAALREELGLVAAKDGCSPSGQCGCCTVLLNGKARVACQIPLNKAQGAEIVTPRASVPRSATATQPPSARPARCSAASARRGSSCGSRL